MECDLLGDYIVEGVLLAVSLGAERS